MRCSRDPRLSRAEHRSKEARLLVDAEHDARRSGSTRLGEGEARGVDEVAADPSSAPALANAVVGSSAAAAGVAARRSGASAMETRPTRMAPTGPKASMTLLTELCGLRGVAWRGALPPHTTLRSEVTVDYDKCVSRFEKVGAPPPSTGAQLPSLCRYRSTCAGEPQRNLPRMGPPHVRTQACAEL